jgi:nicotinamidase-related amidase
MSNPSHIYEPLTSENVALVLVDHQVGLMSGVRDYSIAELKHNIVGLAKAAKALKLPIVVTTTARDSMWGPTIPELLEALPEVQIIDRSSVNAFDDPRVAHAIETTGRRKLVFAGLSLEVCAAFPAITAVSRGLDAYVAVDACGTFSETKHQVGLLRMMQAGVILSDYATLMIEVLGDNARREAAACLRRNRYGLGQAGGPDREILRTLTNGPRPAASGRRTFKTDFASLRNSRGNEPKAALKLRPKCVISENPQL